ncbi:MAG: TadE/TadG family type IV pilus assembly protein [Janthinobacterium lividum]
MNNAPALMARNGRTPRDGRVRARQRGLAAVEFAIVFPLLFVIFYGIVSYSLIFVAQQTLTMAAEEGARAALAYDSAVTTNTATVTTACTAAKNAASWIGANTLCCATGAAPSGGTCTAPVLSACAYSSAIKCLSMDLVYDLSAHPIIPVLPGTTLVLPTLLRSSATVQCNGSACALITGS